MRQDLRLVSMIRLAGALRGRSGADPSRARAAGFSRSSGGEHRRRGAGRQAGPRHRRCGRGCHIGERVLKPMGAPGYIHRGAAGPRAARRRSDATLLCAERGQDENRPGISTPPPVRAWNEMPAFSDAVRADPAHLAAYKSACSIVKGASVANALSRLEVGPVAPFPR